MRLRSIAALAFVIGLAPCSVDAQTHAVDTLARRHDDRPRAGELPSDADGFRAEEHCRCGRGHARRQVRLCADGRGVQQRAHLRPRDQTSGRDELHPGRGGARRISAGATPATRRVRTASSRRRSTSRISTRIVRRAGKGDRRDRRRTNPCDVVADFPVSGRNGDAAVADRRGAYSLVRSLRTDGGLSSDEWRRTTGEPTIGLGRTAAGRREASQARRARQREEHPRSMETAADLCGPVQSQPLRRRLPRVENRSNAIVHTYDLWLVRPALPAARRSPCAVSAC